MKPHDLKDRMVWLDPGERSASYYESEIARLTKERDEARQHLKERKALLAAALVRTQAAEAECIACRQLWQELLDISKVWSPSSIIRGRLDALVAHGRPGAALLEEVRRLRELERLLRLDMTGDEPARLSANTISKLDALDHFREARHD